MDPSMQRKDHETQHFMDHSLLATELMDLMDTHTLSTTGVFPKNVGAPSLPPNAHGNYVAEKEEDPLTPDLSFHSTIFQFVDKHVHSETHHSLEHAPVPPTHVGPTVATQTTGYVPEKHAAPDFLNLNSSFLDHQHVGHGGDAQVPVATYPAHAIEPTVPMHAHTALHDDDELLYAPHGRKVLPHKKRIARKLKCTPFELDPITPVAAGFVDSSYTTEPHKRLPYTCEICGYIASAQIDFFAHLKQHYEPTLNDVATSKSCDSLCNAINAKVVTPVQGDDDQVKLDQVLRAVQLNFDDFHNTLPHEPVDVSVVMHTNPTMPLMPQTAQATSANEVVAGGVGVGVGVGNTVAVSVGGFVTNADNLDLKNNANNVVDDVEFSDTEDMLEGMRTVVDKVSFEDTCDELDLITSNAMRAPAWFNNVHTNYSDLNFRNCDESFSGQLSQLLIIGEPAQATTSTATTTTTSDIVHPPPPPPPTDKPTNTLPPFLVTQHETLVQPLVSDGENNKEHMLLETHVDMDNNKTQTLSPVTVVTTIQPIGQTSTTPEMNHVHIYNDTSVLHVRAPSPAAVVYRDDDDDNDNDVDDDEEDDNDVDNYIAEEDIEEEHDSDSDATPAKPNKKRTKALTPGRLKQRATNAKGKGKKRHTCDKCQREFNSLNALKYHGLTHTQNRQYHCDECGQNFFALGALKAHQRTHSGEKPFECQHCQRKFRQFGDLKYHTDSLHSDVKAHMCEYCGKSFSRKYSLVIHRRIHTSERNFSCDFCSKTFRASCYLNSHLKIHTGEKPYPCTVCGKRFRVYGDMRRHLRIHDRAKAADADATEEFIAAS